MFNIGDKVVLNKGGLKLGDKLTMGEESGIITHVGDIYMVQFISFDSPDARGVQYMHLYYNLDLKYLRNVKFKKLLDEKV